VVKIEGGSGSHNLLMFLVGACAHRLIISGSLQLPR